MKQLDLEKVLIGARINMVRRLYDQEVEDLGLETSAFDVPLIVELDNGYELFASSDVEMNDCGAMYLFPPDGQGIPLLPPDIPLMLPRRHIPIPI